MHVLGIIARSVADYMHIDLPAELSSAGSLQRSLYSIDFICVLQSSRLMSRVAPPKLLMMMLAGLLMAAAIAPGAAQQPATVQPTSGTSSTTVQAHPFNGLDVR